jgi:pimeloyl-ACP methyl ester carboxylesterase
MPLVRAGKIELFTSDTGRGAPLLLVHGFPLDHRMWREQVAELSGRFRVIAPDLRGFGASPAAGDTASMEQYADDLAALLDALDVREPVAFCGLSMGGYIAWQFWRRHAPRLARLILCDTRASADTPEAARNRLEMAQRVLDHGTAEVAPVMLPRLLAPGTQQQRPELVEWLRRQIDAVPPQAIAAAQRAMAARPDASAWLAGIKVPTLVVVGEHDAISTVAEMRGLAEAIPGATLLVVPAAGHLAPLENPAPVNRALAEFLAR